MKQLKVKIIGEVKRLFWGNFYPQNIVIAPIVVDRKDKYFLNPMVGEVINTDKSMYSLEPEYQISPSIKTCYGYSRLYAKPITLENDKFEISKDEFFLRVSFISSFVVIEYKVLLNENSYVSVAWTFQLLKEVVGDF